MRDGGGGNGPHKTPLFETLNSYSNKRGTVNIGNPAIIWHRAYWRPPKWSNEKWHRVVNEYISLTFEKLYEQGRSKLAASRGGRVDIRTTQSGQTGPIGDDLSAFYVSFEEETANVTIVFEKFDEFWSIKTVVDFSKVLDSDLLSPGCFKQMYRALTICEQVIVDGVNASRIDPPPPHDPAVRQRLDDTVKQASLEVSTALHTLTEQLFPHPAAHSELGMVIALQDLFAHFVGFSLGIDNQTDPAARLDPAPTAGIVSRVSPRRFFSRNAEKLGNLVDAIWPVAKWLNPIVAFDNHGAFSAPEPAPEDDQLKREFTISRLNRGRAIYMTSLGGIQSPPHRNIYFPLSYLLVSPHKASWQLGRMVDRLHTLGVFRLAILRDYELVEESNTRMRELINKLNTKEDTVEGVSDDFDHICPNITNGLHYRIEWSRYYMTLYRESVQMLNFERIEGYQTYPEFISRKFSGRFHTIDNVSRRFDYLSRQIRDKINQSTEITIAELLNLAEIASIFPIAYYSYYVFEHVNHFFVKNTPWRVDKALESLIGKLGWNPDITYELPWIIVVVLYSSYVFKKNFSRRTRRKKS